MSGDGPTVLSRDIMDKTSFLYRKRMSLAKCKKDKVLGSVNENPIDSLVEPGKKSL